MRAKHAAVDVRLVEDDEREVGEQIAPRRVVREDADVQHVGIGHDQVRALTDRRALGTGRAPRLGVRAHGVLEHSPQLTSIAWTISGL